MILRILLLHLSYLGIGLALVHRFVPDEGYPAPLRLLFGYYLGVLVHVLILHIALVAGVSSTALPWVLLVLGDLALVSALWFWLRARTPLPVLPELTWPDAILPSALALVLLVPVALITLELVGLPDVSYDSTAFWNLKAKYFFYGEHLWTEAFMDPARVHPHRDYPLYRPIFTFEHFAVLGSADDFAVKPGTWIYHLAGVGLLFVLVREWADAKIALATIGLMLYTPVYSWNAIQGSITTTYADFSLSLMILATVGFFARYVHWKQPLDLFAATVAVASAVLLKREGTVWLLIFLVCAGIALYAMRRRGMSAKYGWLALPVLVAVGWYGVRHFIPLAESEVQLSAVLSDPGRVAAVVLPVLDSWTESFVDVRRWGVLHLFIVPAFLVGLVRNLRARLQLAAPLMVLSYFAFTLLLLTLLAAHTGNLDYWMARTYPRLVLHFLPAALLLAVVMNCEAFVGYITPEDGRRNASEMNR